MSDDIARLREDYATGVIDIERFELIVELLLDGRAVYIGNGFWTSPYWWDPATRTNVVVQ
jgi:hypothetical protein